MVCTKLAASIYGVHETAAACPAGTYADPTCTNDGNAELGASAGRLVPFLLIGSEAPVVQWEQWS